MIPVAVSECWSSAAVVKVVDHEWSVKLEDYQRRLYLLLRATWGRDFLLQPSSGKTAFLQDRSLFLPAKIKADQLKTAEALYRAMAFHAAAHLMYTECALPSEGLSAEQRFLIGLVDDARVEYLAIQHDASLQKLWYEHILQIAPAAPDHPVIAIVQQLVLGLLDARYSTSHTTLNQWLAEFHQHLPQHGHHPEFSLEKGKSLFTILSQAYPALNMVLLNTVRIRYRDDNRLLWDSSPEARLATLPYRMQCLTQLGGETLPKTIYAQLARQSARQKTQRINASNGA